MAFDPPERRAGTAGGEVRAAAPTLVSVMTSTCGRCSRIVSSLSARRHQIWGHLCLPGMGCRVGKESTQALEKA